MPKYLLRPLIVVWLLADALIALAIGVGYLLPVHDQMVYTKAFDNNNQRIANLFLRDTVRNIEQRLTNGYGVNALPKWSPDGQHIVYLSLIDGMFQPYIIDALGHYAHPLAVTVTRFKDDFVWSPDSRWILFSATIEGIEHSAIINVVTGQLNILPRTMGSGMWLPDSQTIVYLGTAEDSTPRLYALNINCFDQSQACSFAELDLLRNYQFYDRPTWSLDGHSFVFKSYFNRQFNMIIAHLRCPDLIEQCVANYELVGKQPYLAGPIWSTDSKRLVYAAGQSEIDILQVETGSTQTFSTSNLIYSLENWSPDGQFVMYFATQSYKTNLYILDIINGETRLLFPNSMAIDSPEWRPRPH